MVFCTISCKRNKIKVPGKNSSLINRNFLKTQGCVIEDSGLLIFKCIVLSDYCLGMTAW